jgi:basic membrane lipoprotein Med (substrate-binding protein (PBP1-ABC) superfamily)
MNRKLLYILAAIVVSTTLLLSACGPAETPAPEETAAPTAPPPTEAPPPTIAPTPTETPPCLIIGALYGGPITDAGYNQAMHESVMAIKQNIACVQIIEAENVPDEAGATTTMENMIQQGAKMIIATAYNHQYPALTLSQSHPDVIFEHAGGWMMADNFANFYGEPPDTWYLMGIAAGLMTKSNKLGFVAAMPLGWTLTFINAFEIGAQSVNPEATTIVTFTGSWSDRAKEAAATDALINQGADIITMHVDSPSTVIQTAEARQVYSIGFQSLASQQFAPQYWITGAGFTFGGLMTGFAQSVMDGTWKPNFIRCSISDGCMAIAPFGPKVPEEVKTQFNQALADLEAGKITIFKGPILDQDGTLRVKEGEVIAEDQLGNVDWFVKGVIGQPK